MPVSAVNEFSEVNCRVARVAVIGAGMAGLTAAIDLAGAAARSSSSSAPRPPGGKMREMRLGD